MILSDLLRFLSLIFIVLGKCRLERFVHIFEDIWTGSRNTDNYPALEGQPAILYMSETSPLPLLVISHTIANRKEVNLKYQPTMRDYNAVAQVSIVRLWL